MLKVRLNRKKVNFTLNATWDMLTLPVDSYLHICVLLVPLIGSSRFMLFNQLFLVKGIIFNILIGEFVTLCENLNNCQLRYSIFRYQYQGYSWLGPCVLVSFPFPKYLVDLLDIYTSYLNYEWGGLQRSFKHTWTDWLRCFPHSSLDITWNPFVTIFNSWYVFLFRWGCSRSENIKHTGHFLMLKNDELQYSALFSFRLKSILNR